MAVPYHTAVVIGRRTVSTRASSALVCALAAVSAVVLPSALSCATSDGGKPVAYHLTAKQNYEKGLAELKEENWPEAQKYFQFVKQKFPFSKYAVLAELALADAHYAEGRYTEAVDDYKSFARLHPTHEKVEDGYTSWRVAQCYVKEMPDDWFLVPPAAEKDQSAVRDAQRELDDFLDKYPDSPYGKDAQVVRKDVLRRLVDHEVYVARFYLDRDHPYAASLRLEAAIRHYPGSGREAELLLALGQTQLHTGNALRARETFRRVVSEFAAAHQARRAQLYLDFIERRWGGNPPAGKPPREPTGNSKKAATANG